MSDDRNRKPPQDDDKRIDAEAARWHAIMADDAEVAGNLENFSVWLEADERHLAAFTRLCTGQAAPAQSAARSVLTCVARLLRPHPVRWAAPVLAIGLMLASTPWSPPDIEVPTGLWQERTGDEGSMMRFGPGSRADIAFTSEQRLVKLAAGSVIIEAAKDPERPLIVETPHGAVRVVGTRFTVIVDTSSTELTVSRGEVQASAAMASGTPLSVRPGQRVHISRQGVTRDPAPIPDAEETYSGWRTLHRVPIDDLVAAVERETGRRVVVLPTPATRAALASGRFRVRDAEATLSLLVEAYGLHRTDAPFGIVVLH